MYKWMYDRMKNEYEKMTKEELIQQIMSLENIECSDRCFANQCEAGSSIYNINELFSKLNSVSFLNNNTEFQNIRESALGSWEYIKSQLQEMNDCGRCSNYLREFKRKVAMAKKDSDII